MTTAYTSLLGLALPVTGELSGTWGDTVNNYITQYLDSSVAGALTVSTDTTLTKTEGGSLGATSSQYAILIADGQSTNITVTAPAASKTYVVINKSPTYTLTVRGSGPTSGVVAAANEECVVAWNGSDFVKVASTVSGDVTGPGSSTDNAIARFDGITGKVIQNSGVTVSDGNVVTATGFAGALNGTVGATTPTTGVFTQVDVTAQGDLRLQDSSGGEYVGLQAPSTVSVSYTLTLPTADGTSGQALITDGSGNLSFGSAGVSAGKAIALSMIFGL